MQLPIIVIVYNMGAMFISENVSTGSRTRHIDIRHHFFRQFVEEGFIKIIFVRSEENLADGFMKNICAEIYKRHVGNFIEGSMDEQMGEEEGDLGIGKEEEGDGSNK